jgi:PAT family beta-lactamase induction signal transducer AmpG
MNSILHVFASRRMALVLFLGFCSGLPLSLTGSTLQAWMTESKVDLATIGRFALVGLPYTMKFLWSPLLDNARPLFWGRRRGWAILTQIALVISIALMGSLDPETELGALSLLAIAVAFFSASQDIVLDAFRTELLKPEELGAGAGVYVMGYRLAMLVSGALALVLADHFDWQQVYWLMSGLMALGSLAVVFAPEPNVENAVFAAGTKTPWSQKVLQPFLDFFKRSGAIEILLFVMVYKLSTMMATALTTTFLLSLGFSKTEIGAVTKVFGLIATIVGTLTGGALMVRLGTKRALWIFGFLQSLAGLTFLILSYTGKNTAAMTAVITVENFMIGLGVAALSGFMMAVCNRQFTATQFALLSSLTAVSRVVLVSQAGVIAEGLGWHGYFIFSVLLAIPGLLLLTRYDRWQSMEAATIGRREITQGIVFLAGLAAIASEPIWNWLGLKAQAPIVAQAGAALVGGAIALGLIPQKKNLTA